VALLGERVVVHGKDLHAECMNLSFVAYALFCVTGRIFPAHQARVIEEFWLATGYPDARIWCNRIAAYLASARVDPGLAMSAAIAASNSQAYGFGAMASAYTVQAGIPEPADARTSWLADKLASGVVLHGYGRPMHGSDERIGVALRSLTRHGIRAGAALKRAFWLHRALHAHKGIELNIAGVWAAVAIDFGLDQAAYSQLMLLMFAPGHMAVYADQRARPALSFLPGYQTSP
jgi:citrate synthase